MRAKITKAAVDTLRPGHMLADTDVKGFVVRRLPSGVATYGLRYRAGGKQRWLALGIHGHLTPDSARRLAKKRIGEVADDRDPAAEREAARIKADAARASTVNALLDAFLERYVRGRLRSAPEIERIFGKYVRPRIGAKSIYEIRRRDVVEMLDRIEDENGPVMADRTLAYVRAAFNWHATRDEGFTPPLVRGMARTKTSERARRRILDDQEIRDLWAALETAKVPAPYPRFVRALLLTAQRRDEIATLRWEAVEKTVFIIDADDHKSGNTVPLTDEIRALLGKPRKHGFVFTTTGGMKAFSGFGKAKHALDKAITNLRKKERRGPMRQWQLHDLRRTARSLMSRVGVAPDIGERVLGHVIPGVRGVYDRHSFIEEKRDALERLGALVGRILNPPGDNVVALGRLKV